MLNLRRKNDAESHWIIVAFLRTCADGGHLRFAITPFVVFDEARISDCIQSWIISRQETKARRALGKSEFSWLFRVKCGNETC